MGIFKNDVSAWLEYGKARGFTEFLFEKELKKIAEDVIREIDEKDLKMKCAYGSCSPNCSHVEVARANLRILKDKLIKYFQSKGLNKNIWEIG